MKMCLFKLITIIQALAITVAFAGGLKELDITKNKALKRGRSPSSLSESTRERPLNQSTGPMKYTLNAQCRDSRGRIYELEDNGYNNCLNGEAYPFDNYYGDQRRQIFFGLEFR